MKAKRSCKVGRSEDTCLSSGILIIVIRTLLISGIAFLSLWTRRLLRSSCFIAAAVSMLAGPLDRSKVASDAKWILHFDVEGLRATTLGGVFVTDLLNSVLEGGEEAKKAKLLTSISNVTSITSYGAVFDESTNAVQVITTRSDAKQLLDTLAKIDANSNAPFTLVEKKPLPIYSFATNMFIAAAGDVLFVAYSKERIKQAHQVVLRKTKSLAKDSAFQNFSDASRDFVFLAMAEDFSGTLGIPPQLEILREMRRAWLRIGQRNQNLVLDLIFQGKDDMATTKIQQVLQGIVALVRLNEDKDISQMADAIKITSERRNVSLTVEYPAEKAIAQIKRQIYTKPNALARSQDTETKLSPAVEPLRTTQAPGTVEKRSDANEASSFSGSIGPLDILRKLGSRDSAKDTLNPERMNNPPTEITLPPLSGLSPQPKPLNRTQNSVPADGPDGSTNRDGDRKEIAISFQRKGISSRRGAPAPIAAVSRNLPEEKTIRLLYRPKSDQTVAKSIWLGYFDERVSKWVTKQETIDPSGPSSFSIPGGQSGESTSFTFALSVTELLAKISKVKAREASAFRIPPNLGQADVTIQFDETYRTQNTKGELQLWSPVEVEKAANADQGVDDELKTKARSPTNDVAGDLSTRRYSDLENRLSFNYPPSWREMMPAEAKRLIGGITSTKYLTVVVYDPTDWTQNANVQVLSPIASQDLTEAAYAKFVNEMDRRFPNDFPGFSKVSSRIGRSSDVPFLEYVFEMVRPDGVRIRQKQLRTGKGDREAVITFSAKSDRYDETDKTCFAIIGDSLRLD